MNRYRRLFFATALAAVALARDPVAPRADEAAPIGSDTTRAVTPAPTPDPRAFSNPNLSLAQQDSADAKFRKELELAHIDSLHLNESAKLFLHAVPRHLHRTSAQVALQVRDCDSLVTAVPPGEWDVFLIAAGHDLVNGVAFSFGWPADWNVDGFTLSPELKTPFSMGDLRAQDLRPMMVVFDCVANPARQDATPTKARFAPGDLVVIGKLSVLASSPGSLTLLDHSDARYGAPKVVNCWNRPRDIPIAARGRIDVGSGPGLKPCDGGGPLAQNLISASGKSMAGENEGPKKP